MCQMSPKDSLSIEEAKSVKCQQNTGLFLSPTDLV